MDKIFKSFGNVCSGTEAEECDNITSMLESRLPNPNPPSTTDITDIFNVAYGMAAVVAVGFIVYGGIQYINSAGDSGKVARAKNTIVFAIAGLLVVLLASTITNIALEAM